MLLQFQNENFNICNINIQSSCNFKPAIKRRGGKKKEKNPNTFQNVIWNKLISVMKWKFIKFVKCFNETFLLELTQNRCLKGSPAHQAAAAKFTDIFPL